MSTAAGAVRAAAPRRFRNLRAAWAFVVDEWRTDRATRFIVLTYAIVQLAAAGWDLPGSWGWENDGVAPRDLFGGLAFNLTPGGAHRYPLFHYLLLAVVSLPVLLVGLVTAPSLAGDEIMAHMLSVPVMTGVAVVAKLLSIAMGVVLLLVVGRLARRLFDGDMTQRVKYARAAGRIRGAADPGPLPARPPVPPRAHLHLPRTTRPGHLEDRSGGRPDAKLSADAPNRCVNSAPWAVAFAATCLSVAYYTRATNLDGPYLLWTALALDRFLTLAESPSRRHWTLLGFFAGAAVATKDQAFASFVLWLPLLISLPSWSAVVRGRDHWRGLARTTIAGLLTLGVLGGALINPPGFARRVGELIGSSSQDWRQYEPGLAGVLANLRDLGAAQAEFWWPWPVVALAWLGTLLALTSRAGPTVPERRIWRALPLITGLSFLVFFTLPVARCEHRFALPIGLWLSIYGGYACARLAALPRMRRFATAGAVLLLAWALAHTFVLTLTQWGDARRQVTTFLDALPRGSQVETYGLTVYQPHFDLSPDAAYHLTRVGTDNPRRRNPMVGAEELRAPVGDVSLRDPDVLVIPEGYARRFLAAQQSEGRAASRVRERAQADEDARDFFRRAVLDALPHYELAFVAEPALPDWARALGAAPAQLHGSTGLRVWVLTRTLASTPPSLR